MAESNREEIAKLEALYANNPGGRVFTHLAEAYRKAGELDRARQILEDGITRHAEYASAHVVLGRVLQDQGALADASAAFRRVLELDPENRVALRSLGDLAREGNQREEALAYFRQLLSLDPTDDQLVRIIDQLNTAIHTVEAEPLPALDTADNPDPVGAKSGTQEPDFAGSTPGSDPSRTEELASAEEFAADSATAEASASVDTEAAAAEEESRSVDAGMVTAGADEPFRVESFEGVDPAEFHANASAEAGSFAPPTGDLGEYVTPDVSLDWDSEGLPHGDAPALPGDLAAFAAAESADIEDVSLEDVSLEDISPLEATPLEAGAPEPESHGEAPAGDGEVQGSDLSLPEGPVQAADAVEDAMTEVGEFIDLGEEPVSSEHEPTFEDLLSSTADAWKSLPEPEPTELQAELQTETLAELYLSQGFNERAAEVYRSLIERNPGDERLRQRLADVEAKLAGPGAADESGAEDADTLDSFWAGAGESESIEPTLYAWTEPDEPAGPSIGNYFGEMLSWRPSAGNGHAPTRALTADSASSSVSAESPASAEVPAPAVAPASAEVPAPAEAPLAGAAASAFAEVAPPAGEGGEPDTAFEEVVAETAGPGESAFEEVTAPKDTESFVAQESTTPVSTSGMLSQFSAPLNEVEAAFEEWFSGVPNQPKPPAEPAAPAAAPSMAQGKPAYAPAAPEPNPAAPAPSAEARPAASSASSEESEDDEDLEMFRSWLQSLKR